MDQDKDDTQKVSLRSAREADTTVLEEQRLGIASQVSAAHDPKDKSTSKEIDANLEKTQLDEKPVPHKRMSESEEDAEEEEEVDEEEEVEEEEEDEEVEEEEDEDEEEEEEQESVKEPAKPSATEQKTEEATKIEATVPAESNENTVPIASIEPTIPAEAIVITLPTEFIETTTPAGTIGKAVSTETDTSANSTNETKEIAEVENVKETESKDELQPAQPTEQAESAAPDDTHPSEHSEKPALPPPTYLWEEVKKSKEQGGYPWTHLYKDPLGPDDEPEIIMRYSHSPVSQRRKIEEQLIEGNPRAEKKTKTENGDESAQTLKPELTTQETTKGSPTETSITPETSNGHSDSPRRSRARAASHEPHGLTSEFRAHAKHFLDEHPGIRSFSNSLTRKGKRTSAFVSRSLERAKSVADKQIDRAKVQINTLRRRKAASEPPRDLPEHKILLLRESPRLGNREIPAYVVRQPSDEAMDTTAAEEEINKSEDVTLATTTVVPDEIIELPPPATPEALLDTEDVLKEAIEFPPKPAIEPSTVSEEVHIETSTQENMEVEEERYEIIEPPKDYKPAPKVDVEEALVQATPQVEVKAQPPQKAPRKKKEHHYEDIEDNLPPTEEAKDTKPAAEAKLKRQHEIDGFDPIIGEMLGNDKIKISLQLQDEQIAHDMHSRKARLDEILQHSSEDEREKDKIPSLGLLAPISSIDSTSSDEDARRTHLSTLAEESDTGSVDHAVSKKQDSLKENELQSRAHKEQEMTPAEEKQMLDEDGNKTPTNEIVSGDKIHEKQLELTPAEEKMLARAEQRTQITPVEEKVLNTDASTAQKESIAVVETKPVVDERWSKMRYVKKIFCCFSPEKKINA